MPVNIVTIVGGLFLLLIAFALIKRGMKLIGSLVSMVALLALAYAILVVMGVLPDPRAL